MIMMIIIITIIINIIITIMIIEWTCSTDGLGKVT